MLSTEPAAGQIELHPKEAPVRKLMFELFAEHKRKGTVAGLLAERGYKTRRGKNFSKTGIQSLLRDPIAKGKRRCNYTYAEHRGGKVHLKPEEEWEWHDCPATVSEDLWNRCNQILDEQMQTRAPGRRGKYLFAGKVKCEHDLRTMYVLSEAPRFVCRKCRNKLGQEELEQLFCKQLLDFFTSEEDLTKFLGEQQDVLEEKKRQIEVLSAEQVEVEGNRDKIAYGYLDGKIDKVRYDRLECDAEKRIHEIKMGIAGLEGEIAALTIVHTSSEVVIANARELYGRWDVLTHEEKDSIINSIIDDIVVGERNITFNIRYVPFSAKDGNYMQNTFSLLPSGSRK